jgi:hypothetical protein
MRDLWKAGFSRYSDAVRAAGFAPNTMATAYDSSETMLPLAQLVREMGKFPSKGEYMTARRSQPNLPGFEAFVRLGEGSYRRVPSLLLRYCRESGEFLDVVTLLKKSVEASPEISREPSSRSARARVRGYVYLVRHGERGSEYKIGKSNDVARRRKEIALLLPQELVHVHVIETDDPDGIEQYWLRRFKPKHLRGEWHSLSPDDVAAFKRRRYQ